MERNFGIILHGEDFAIHTKPKPLEGIIQSINFLFKIVVEKETEISRIIKLTLRHVKIDQERQVNCNLYLWISGNE